ncbi:hypothetical protein HK097_010449 [Rhizophlyctis rosea]|uniref:RGS domain-containing protein n=1 Tax=Rhizophlyctis rosea TaxID=64517 RepID=A0AAD5S7M7_9FUNG|nr:hypothetical protein HK097_010449 [Rhizophlyctis rosea]
MSNSASTSPSRSSRDGQSGLLKIFETVFKDKTLFAELKAFSEMNNSRENILFYEGILILEDLLRDCSPHYAAANPAGAPPAVLRRFLARHKTTTEPVNRRPVSYSPTPSVKQHHRPLSISPVPSFASHNSTTIPFDPIFSTADPLNPVVIVPPPLYRHYKYIYDFFIAPTAPVEINCSWPAKRQAAAAIASAFRAMGDSTVVVRSDAFDMCADEVLESIWKDTFRGFVTMKGMVGESAGAEGLVRTSSSSFKGGKLTPPGSPSLRPHSSPTIPPATPDIPASPLLTPSNHCPVSSLLSTNSSAEPSKPNRLRRLMRRMSQPSVAIEDAVKFMNLNKGKKGPCSEATPSSPTTTFQTFTFPRTPFHTPTDAPPVPHLNISHTSSKSPPSPTLKSPPSSFKSRCSRRGSVEPLPFPSPASSYPTPPPSTSSSPSTSSLHTLSKSQTFPQVPSQSLALPRISDISESDLDALSSSSSSSPRFSPARPRVGETLSPDEAKERYQAAVGGRLAKHVGRVEA